MALTDVSKLNIFLGETDSTTAKAQAIRWACGAVESYCNREFDQAARTEWIDVSSKGRAMTRSYPITPGTNAILRMPESAIALTLSTGYGGVVYQPDHKNHEDALTLENNGTVTTLKYATYANLTALVAAINLVSGWTARNISRFTFHHLAPVSYAVTGGCELILYAPGQMLCDYEIDRESGIIEDISGFGLMDDDVYISYEAGMDTIPATLEMVATQIAAAALKMKPENPGMKSEAFGDYSYTKAEADDLLTPYMRILDQWRRPVI